MKSLLVNAYDRPRMMRRLCLACKSPVMHAGLLAVCKPCQDEARKRTAKTAPR